MCSHCREAAASLPRAEPDYFCGGGLPLLLAGGGLAGAAPLSAGAAGGVPLSLGGVAVEPELSDGAPPAGALLCDEAGGAAAGWVLEG